MTNPEKTKLEKSGVKASIPSITPTATSFNTVNNTTYNDLTKIGADITTVFNAVNDTQNIYAPILNPTFTGTVTVPNGLNPTDAINLGQLKEAINNDKTQNVARVATINMLSLATLQVVDGISLSEGDRVLVKDQTNGSENGVYIASSGAWVRADEFAEGASVEGYLYSINEGATNMNKFFKVRSSGGSAHITVGASNVIFDEVNSLTISQVNNAINSATAPIISDVSANTANIASNTTDISNLTNSCLMNYPTESANLDVSQLMNTAVTDVEITLNLPAVSLNYVYFLGNSSLSTDNAIYTFPNGATYLPAGSTTGLTSVTLAPSRGIKIAFNSSSNQYTETI